MADNKKPRIPPLREDEWSNDQRQLLEYAYRQGGFYNVIGTLARHPEASGRLGQMGAHVLGPTSTLPPRDRELLILRTAWLCQAEYEWAQHVQIARKAGVSNADVERCREDPEAAGWNPFDAALIHAADELHAQQCISDATWTELAGRYDTLQLMDVVFAVGQYTLIAMALKTFQTPLDDGLAGF
ncbi:MAG: carboxymuconolactone decarboxylase family protein [Gammaproteobacteria bacterium]|nr:carboxymuconolactone decarboxylase family protein [Gammaproteobacteria bacterium]